MEKPRLILELEKEQITARVGEKEFTLKQQIKELEMKIEELKKKN
jgi:hypothetical protein